MSRIQFPTNGLGTTSAYQVSGRPWQTGSLVEPNSYVKIEFPSVTKSFTIVNMDSGSVSTGEIQVMFCDTGSVEQALAAKHYTPISGSGNQFKFDVKCKHVIVSAGASTGSFFLMAELTHIADYEMYVLTGSGIDE